MNLLVVFLLLQPAPRLPDVLVPPGWVAEHGAVAVDVRPVAVFLAGHRPGAVRVALVPECVAAGVECVQRELGRAGLAGDEAAVVVGEDGAAVGEAFWLLEWAGLKGVKVLDGGSAAGRGAETGPVPHALPFDFRRWLPGEGGWPAAGRVWETLQGLGPRAVTKVDPKAEFVLYGEGPADLRPGLGYLLLRRAGIPVRVFPGGFQAWSRDPADPVVRIVGAPEVDRLLEAENPGLKGDEVARSVVLLDLREAWDFKHEHIPGAYNFPAYTEGTSIGTVVAARWPQAKAARTPVVLYCYGRPCIRSRDAAAKLAREGFTNLLWLREGIEAWREAGLPVAGRPHGAAPTGHPSGPYFAGSNFKLTPFMQ